MYQPSKYPWEDGLADKVRNTYSVTDYAHSQWSHHHHRWPQCWSPTTIVRPWSVQQHLRSTQLETTRDQPTRKSKTLIDHVISNCDTKLIASDVVFCDVTHYFVSSRSTNHGTKHDTSTLETNEPSYQLPLNVIYAFDDVSDKIGALNKFITDCIDRYAHT